MLKLTLVTPVKRLAVDLPVAEVFVPGFRGELNILPGHAPLVTNLNTGVLKYREEGATELKTAAISWGYCEVYADQVSVLAETAEYPEEIDIERAQFALRKAQEAVVTPQEDFDVFTKYHLKLERAATRIEVAKLKKGE